MQNNESIETQISPEILFPKHAWKWENMFVYLSFYLYIGTGLRIKIMLFYAFSYPDLISLLSYSSQAQKPRGCEMSALQQRASNFLPPTFLFSYIRVRLYIVQYE